MILVLMLVPLLVVMTSMNALTVIHVMPMLHVKTLKEDLLVYVQLINHLVVALMVVSLNRIQAVIVLVSALSVITLPVVLVLQLLVLRTTAILHATQLANNPVWH